MEGAVTRSLVTRVLAEARSGMWIHCCCFCDRSDSVWSNGVSERTGGTLQRDKCFGRRTERRCVLYCGDNPARALAGEPLSPGKTLLTREVGEHVSMATKNGHVFKHVETFYFECFTFYFLRLQSVRASIAYLARACARLTTVL